MFILALAQIQSNFLYSFYLRVTLKKKEFKRFKKRTVTFPQLKNFSDFICHWI